MPSDLRKRVNIVLDDPLNRGQIAAQRLSSGSISRRQQEEDSPIYVPQTYRPLAGLESNARGQTLRFNTAVDGNGTNSVRKTVAQARSVGEDAESLIVTLSLGYEPSVPTQSHDSRIQAIITWGIGGAQHEVTCDWIQGTVLAVSANYVRVDVVVPSQSAFVFKPIFLFAASFGYGPAPTHKNRARLTVALVPFTGVVTQDTIAIPPFAIGFNIQSDAIISTEVGLIQKDAGAIRQVLNTWMGNSNNYNQSTDAFPVMLGASRLTVSSANAQNINVIFDLAL